MVSQFYISTTIILGKFVCRTFRGHIWVYLMVLIMVFVLLFGAHCYQAFTARQPALPHGLAATVEL